MEVFFDPFYQGGDASTEDEAREFIIGYSLAQRLLLVVYVDRGERTRIISARQATRPERKRMKKPEGEPLLSVRPRETEVVALAIPKDTLASLRQVAAQREMSEQALLKFYIGQGLRQDLARLFGERVLATTAHVLARHLQSDEAVAAIMREIREEAVG